MSRRDVVGRALALAAAAGVRVAGAATVRPSGDGVAAPSMLLAREAAVGQSPVGYRVSEKLDGVRAQWDGRELRFRGGGVVPAPGWFTAGLPSVALDGELWLGRGRFEALTAIVRDRQPDDAGWRQVRYGVFELPGAPGPFAERAARMAQLVSQAEPGPLMAVEQWELLDAAALQARLASVVAQGGEGLMLHRADAPYVTGRSEVLLKLKPLQDGEAVVVGHVAGKGRFVGQLGALRVRTPQGREFALGTGFSDAQRASPPPRGTVVTYTYRGTTARGLPRFASFLRVAGP
ncbi:MAG: DNA ligase [Methylibium petroleiphilum]|nr:DNA ligase [Methylibium petroleiphilum]MBN9203178.1 DNA ligase [Methylibium petroleiphilum]